MNSSGTTASLALKTMKNATVNCAERERIPNNKKKKKKRKIQAFSCLRPLFLDRTMVIKIAVTFAERDIFAMRKTSLISKG